MADDITQILIVDDDERLRDLLKQYLLKEGYAVITAEDALAARKILEEEMVDIAIVDVMMPGESGIELTKSLKENPPWLYPMPILMLTAQNEPEDRIRGLESGADDYLAKPFEPRELVLRIENLLQYVKVSQTKPDTKTSKIIKFGEFIFNKETGDLQQNGRFINLTSTEIKLLTIFVEHINRPVTREYLSEAFNGISERSVDVQVARLRKRIEDDPKKPYYLVSQWGQGYIFKNRD